MVTWFLIYFIAINLVAVFLYGFDKLKAKMKRFRIPEATLLLIAVLGGAYGAMIGMYLFHHKTKKPKFYITVPVLVLLYTLLFYYVLL